MIILIVVVLPEPDGPMTPISDPRGTSSDSDLTATTDPNRRLTPRMATAGGTSGEAADAAAAGRAVLSSRATKPSQGTAAERAASDSVAAGRLRGRPWILDSAYGLVTTGTRARTRSRIPPHAELAHRTAPVTGV